MARLQLQLWSGIKECQENLVNLDWLIFLRYLGANFNLIEHVAMEASMDGTSFWLVAHGSAPWL